MNDSLKYGLPIGIISFLLLYVNLWWLADLSFLIRWIVEAMIGLGLVLYSVKLANRAYFPFSFAFFSGFNVLFVAIAIKAVLILIFRNWILTEIPSGIPESKWLAYSIFRESMGHFVIGLVSLAGLSWFFMKKSK